MPEQDSIQGWIDGLSDDELMALTLLAEARGEDTVGRQMVASVIVNRRKFSLEWRATHNTECWWGETIREIILKPWQFSSWNENDPNRAKMPDFIHHPLYPECLTIATAAISGNAEDFTKGAVNYLNPQTASPQKWATPDKLTVSHLHHDFYRL